MRKKAPLTMMTGSSPWEKNLGKEKKMMIMEEVEEADVEAEEEVEEAEAQEEEIEEAEEEAREEDQEELAEDREEAQPVEEEEPQAVPQGLRNMVLLAPRETMKLRGRDLKALGEEARAREVVAGVEEE